MQLHEQLADSSSAFAQSALKALPAGDHATFVLHASIALEHAMKALLARRHPALIAAPDFDSLLHACGDSADARVPRHRMRTVTGRESLNRVGQLLPSVQLLSAQLAPLFEVRNAVAHLGEPALSDELRVPFLKCAEHVRKALGLERSSYWGEFADLTEAALEEQIHEARLHVETALATARVEFERRYGHLAGDARDLVIRAIEASYRPTKYEEDTVDCPACGRTALVSGATETHWEEEFGEDYSFIATFTSGYLRCSVCDLELDGEDELQLAGVEEVWDIQDASPADFYDPDDY